MRPDGNVYMATLTESTRELGFWRRPADDLTTAWEYLSVLGGTISDSDRDGSLPPTQRKRISLLFLPYLAGDSHGVSVFPDGSGYLGAFWNSGNPLGTTNPDLETLWDDWYALRAYTTGYVSPTGSNWSGGLQPYGKPTGFRAQKHINRPVSTSSVAVARRFNHAIAAFAKFSFTETTNVDNLVREPPTYLPFANGISPWRLGVNEDNNDADFIDLNLCASVRYLLGSSCQCGGGPQTECITQPPPPVEERTDCEL